MIHNFQDEFELIGDDNLREFAVEAISKMDPDSFTERDIDYIKKVVQHTQAFCEVVDADDPVRDIVTVASLVHYIAYDGTPMYPLATRIMLNDLMPKIGREAFANIMFLVERQLGFHSPFPEYQPELDSPVHAWLLPLAIKLSKDV
ncbi:hypothetical protein [Paenibacillus xylanexedens]|uniref:hypothetical protein n=1 Tax=Paenibacillus xylanexedens TaxID=528191 RepID=UPI000F52BADA|nr:hypothetical protein [Paenibacillus xylanexedens]RPK20013.1 hypothetical protein EDO6_06530 [Paenibacillus xylanexedens]